MRHAPAARAGALRVPGRPRGYSYAWARRVPRGACGICDGQVKGSYLYYTLMIHLCKLIFVAPPRPGARLPLPALREYCYGHITPRLRVRRAGRGAVMLVSLLPMSDDAQTRDLPGADESKHLVVTIHV